MSRLMLLSVLSFSEKTDFAVVFQIDRSTVLVSEVARWSGIAVLVSEVVWWSGITVLISEVTW